MNKDNKLNVIHNTDYNRYVSSVMTVPSDDSYIKIFLEDKIRVFVDKDNNYDTDELMIDVSDIVTFLKCKANTIKATNNANSMDVHSKIFVEFVNIVSIFNEYKYSLVRDYIKEALRNALIKFSIYVINSGGYYKYNKTIIMFTDIAFSTNVIDNIITEFNKRMSKRYDNK